MITLQQFGPQRTGTNAVKALVDHNLQGAMVDPDGKHEVPGDYKGDGYLVSIKDPVSWVCSYHRYLRMRSGDGDFYVDDWLAHWQRLTTSHLHLANAVPSRTVVIQHEWLLRDPSAVVHEIKRTFELPWSGSWNLFQQGYAKRGGGRVGAELIDTSKDFDRSFHLEGRWVETLPLDVLRHCLSFLDDFIHYYPQHARYFDLHHLDRARESAR